ncbi:leucyl aminopeptidase [Thermobifida fusca TM51]|uniref:Probable cytosol aminopeptidase n=1 Tax=Thermobifida fusca TM51 TaxID=1169414 RepID=A0A9P2TCC4_THEFU|nr:MULTISPECIES: leucyl aminopeptidase [Thermobifida]EOR72380.1 leucyl aminopeptidase [Thermobifida fusca TM51]MBO2529596.1 leucyl aminopeptidase [Thermobifida sp.]PPS93431.1 leucyl aminopeptidase [Thermobifida fusca]PZN60051.1 MAG: leucyl aminopeptidase [Thermobifida fusca]QOS60451.1 leucyl aminopeptidase [Thermobifida fusca]
MPLATEIHPTDGVLAESTADRLAIIVRAGTDGPQPVADGVGLSLTNLDARLPASVAQLFDTYEFRGKAGQIVEFPVDLGRGLIRLSFLGVGDATPEEMRKAGAAFARSVRGSSRAAVNAAVSGHDPEALTAFVEGALLASYTFTLTETAEGTAPAAAIDLVGSAASEAAEPTRRGTVLARATAMARDLINTPAAEKSPAWLASRAEAIGAEAGLSVRVWDEEALYHDGFGAILTVGQGSPRPPRLVELSYRPAGATEHIVLVGKGITFDTGGLSLKPNDNMKLMKTDMSGAGIILAVLSAVQELGVRVSVTGLLAIAENAFSGSAMRLGDVLTTYSGRTVEVLNSDAEGRLVLADAIGYAVTKLAPDTLVDVATLTGAARVALGSGIGALFATDDTLAAALVDAGKRSGETLWRMPLHEEYRDALDSPVADLANTSVKDDYGHPGAIEAALFLREFVGSVPWAHLDIAGPGRSMSDEGILSKGGTAFGTRLLLRWLAER